MKDNYIWQLHKETDGFIILNAKSSSFLRLAAVSKKDAEMQYARAVLHTVRLNEMENPQAKMIFDGGSDSENPMDKVYIHDTWLSRLTINSLRFSGIHTVSDMLRFTDAELLKLNHFGKKSLDEVHLFIKENDLKREGLSPIWVDTRHFSGNGCYFIKSDGIEHSVLVTEECACTLRRQLLEMNIFYTK